MNRIFFLVALFALSLSNLATAATVFVQYPDPGGPGITSDPTFATRTGPGFFTEADLGSAYFKAKSESPDASFAYAGLQNLTFTNPLGSAPILLPAGALGVNITGQYSFGPPAPSGESTAGASIIGVLSVNDGSVARVARGDHTLGTHWVNGAVFNPTNTTTPTTLNGGTVLFNTATLTNLDMTLLMPAMTIDPGETLELTFLLQTITGANGSGVKSLADASNSARIFLNLPAGVSLIDNAGTTLSWVKPVPLPGAFSLFGMALAGLVMCRRRAVAKPR
ncbi:hypothetical protein NP590_19445 [Methylomonas sp. SURF-2]|uniref:PEP-CTERM protein-sorting domain-containing protein n=1 Tax=Methylomonas subterranea TaxID=2952225 RepID=A0ABT1TLE0_9GAMM|nr:hypothetical protein [Methylomonas sp. SURF-2]MCQ8106289.1 hypothetical protein [Methylomonas sp. SURF-2]